MMAAAQQVLVWQIFLKVVIVIIMTKTKDYGRTVLTRFQVEFCRFDSNDVTIHFESSDSKSEGQAAFTVRQISTYLLLKFVEKSKQITGTITNEVMLTIE
ncbi:hypothetical protein Zmor_017943 [Zophobas morio]|uniref:Uncharacterized protein n=1 Tax=Zophobas morio TaxID=2755281 RepID=A0AA38MDB3_9CUCU|nr:hypothetical protein Zmor_017943 [Zophobas morio]